MATAPPLMAGMPQPQTVSPVNGQSSAHRSHQHQQQQQPRNHHQHAQPPGHPHPQHHAQQLQQLPPHHHQQQQHPHLQRGPQSQQHQPSPPQGFYHLGPNAMMDGSQQPRPAPIAYFTNAPQMYQPQQPQHQGPLPHHQPQQQAPHLPHHAQPQPYHMTNHIDHRQHPAHPMPGPPQQLHPRQGQPGPSPPQNSIKWESMDTPNLSMDGDWVDEDSVLGGGAGHSQQEKDVFACPHCDKCYKGKHARSIWRRHLQDKHGIPLSVQPRRTRWDADANRPKNAEERRERMLESKRRWARKKRAQDKAEGRNKASSVMSPDTPGPTPLPPHQGLAPVKQDPDGISMPARQPFGPSIAANVHVNATQPDFQAADHLRAPHGATNYSISAADPQSSTPALDANGASKNPIESSDNNGRPWLSTRHQQPSSSSTLRGAFGPVTDMTPDKRRSPQHSVSSRDGRPSTASQLSPTSAFADGGASASQLPNSATPARLTAPAAVSAQAMARSVSSGSVSGASNPFSLDHHKISPQERTKPLPPTSLSMPDANGSASGRMLGLPSPSNVLAELDNSPTRPPSSAQGAPLGRDRVLPPLLGTPVRPVMKDDGSFLLQSAGRGSAIGDSAIRSSTSRGSRSSHQSRQTLAGSIRGVVGGSSDDEGDLGSSSLMSLSSASRGRMGPYSPSSKSGRRDSLDDGGFDDSGICLSDLTPFHKAIGRQTMGNGGILGLGCGSSVTTPSVMLDSAFPRTVGRPTPLKRSLRPDNDADEDEDDASLAAGNGSPAGRQHKQQRQQRQQRQAQQQQPQHSQFSSPHHPNLAQSLGLAPQSALRSTGSRSLDPGSFDFGGIAQSPFQHSSMTGMSLGFTPWEKSLGAGNNTSLSAAMNGSGGVGAMPNGSPLALHGSAAAAAAVGSPWPGNFRPPLGPRGLGTAHDDDDGDDDDAAYKENQSPLGRAAMLRSRARASGLGSASRPSSRPGRYQPRPEETPSRPSALSTLRSNGQSQCKSEEMSPAPLSRAGSAGSPSRTDSDTAGEEAQDAGMSMGTGLLRFDKLASGHRTPQSGNVTPTRPASRTKASNGVLGPLASANVSQSAESSPSSAGGKEDIGRQLSAGHQHQHYQLPSQQQQQQAQGIEQRSGHRQTVV